MIIQTTITQDGIEFDYTYSDAGKYIVRDGISYIDARDPLGSGRIYTEGDDIPGYTGPTADEILEIVLGGLE